MTADNSRTPRYGDDGAQFRSFRQKNKPHLALAELIGDEKETMDRCAVWGVQWMSEPPGPLPEENRQNYFSRKERKTEKKKAEAKAAVLKKVRERKKRSRSSSGGEPPVLQPDGAACAPATTLPPPEPPTTQWTMPSNEGMPPAYLSWAATQAYSAPPRANGAPPTSTALDSHTPPGPTSSIPDLAHHPGPAPMGAVEVRGARVRHRDVSQTGYATTGPSPGQGTSSGMPLSGHPGANTVYPPAGASCAPEVLATQHAMPGEWYVPQAYLHRVAEQARPTFPTSPLLDRRPLEARACIVPSPHYPTPGLVDRLEQYAASVPYTHDHFRVASQGLDATDHVLSSGPEPTHMADNAYIDAQSAAPLYLGVGSGSPSMDSSPSAPGTWAESRGWDGIPPLRHTAPQPNPGLAAAHDSVGGTEYLYQDFTLVDHHFPGSPSSSIVPGLTPELVEYYLKMAQQANGGYAPQVHAPTMIDDRFGVIARHGAGEQDPQDVHEMAQAVQPPQGGHSVVCWAPSAVASQIDSEQSDDIERAVDDTYAYNHDVPVQYQPATPPSTYNVDGYPPNQSSYSELSQALQYPAPPLMDQRARSSMEKLATSSWSTVPPEADVGFYTHSFSSALGPYAQGLTVDHAQSGMSTHLWSQSAHAPPLYSYDTQPRYRLEDDGAAKNLTHIDSQCFEIRYSYHAPA